MKCFMILFVVCYIFEYSNAVMSEDQTLSFQKIMMECAAKEKATQEDLDEFFAQKSPSSPTAKCMRACMSETLGSIKGNKLDIDTVVEMGTMQLDGDAAKAQKIRDIVTKCADQTDSDRCEAAAKICTCVQKEFQASDLTFTM